MKYILDFDRTLFDTDLFIVQLKSDGYSYDALVPEMLDGYLIEKFLYRDVVSFLKDKSKFDVTILTALGSLLYGDRVSEYQKVKVEQEPILSLVGNFIYVEDVKGEAAGEIAAQFHPRDPVVFVDDLLSQCLSVKQRLPQSHCFLMVRSGSLPEDLPAGIIAVSTLAEVDVIMKGL